MQTAEKIKPCYPLFRDDDYKESISAKREQFEEMFPQDKIAETFAWTTTKDALIYSQIDKPDSSMTCENWRTDS